MSNTLQIVCYIADSFNKYSEHNKILVIKDTYEQQEIYW